MITNINSNIIAIIFLLHIVFIIIFYKKELLLIINKIKDLVYGVKNIKLLNDKNNDKNKLDNKKDKIIYNQKTKRRNKKRKNNKIFKNESEIKQIKSIKFNDRKNKNTELIKPKKNESKNSNININTNLKNMCVNKNKRAINKKNITTTNSSLETKSKEDGDKVKIIMEYKEDEINELKYDIVIEIDSRTYFQYYISLLRTKHNFFFSFFGVDDYNSKIMKIDLYLNTLIIDYAINALFYTDDTMHKIYEDKGLFDLSYHLPITIYSSLISLALNLLLSKLALSNDSIIAFKNIRDEKNINKKGEELKTRIKIKFIFYFIISSIFLIFFWYYLSIFITVYRNTQFHLLKDILINLAISFISPFIIYLLPGLFRIHALNDPKKKSECLYKFSLLLQHF